jgi:hypothetical protein
MMILMMMLMIGNGLQTSGASLEEFKLRTISMLSPEGVLEYRKSSTHAPRRSSP